MFNFDGDYKADIKCEQAFTSGKYWNIKDVMNNFDVDQYWQFFFG